MAVTCLAGDAIDKQKLQSAFDQDAALHGGLLAGAHQEVLELLQSLIKADKMALGEI